ncbi:unnamed protein product [Periconia digitata]|uniref:RecQ-mediated genome instability protein 1 n=1 Tax=Periconia digitata TaxID=1303443 RepID=A0A9W4UQC1_9PLEO|nr:unnamed protein product [Periconia digitata]
MARSGSRWLAYPCVTINPIDERLLTKWTCKEVSMYRTNLHMYIGMYLGVCINTTKTIAGSYDMANTTSNLVAELTQYFNTRHLYPSAAWLQSFVSTIRPNTPLPALKQTALFRLLAADITNTLTPTTSSSVFPRNILDADIELRQLTGPIVCQVLHLEDIGLSRWAQVEAIEAQERGEATRGREVIRVIENETDGSTITPVLQSKGPFKLLLQDAKGAQVYALELNGIHGISSNMSMGAKLLLRNVQVRRAVVMLEAPHVQSLGGKLDSLDNAWKQARKNRLTNAAKSYAGSAS